MIITTIEELRFAAPAHALDSIDGLVGFIDNSEHDFLEDKLGTPLYEALCKYYDKGDFSRSTVDEATTGYWNRLLLISQRCVAFDALGSASGMQVVSVNNSGINQMAADDYKPADKDSVETYRQTCVKEAHKALNRLLTMLEQWCKDTGAANGDGSARDVEDVTPEPSPQSDHDERAEIVALWQKSRYYYRSTASLIPTALCLQDYLNIYDSREKFIQMLPDLLFIQEEQIAPAIGEDFLQWLLLRSLQGDSIDPLTSRIIHRLRKVMAALLVGRTAVIKYTKEQRIQAHDDGVRMLDVACTYIRNQQEAILAALGEDNADIFKSSPLYMEPATAPADEQPHHCGCDATVPDRSRSGSTRTYTKGDPAAWTPPLL